QIETTVRRVFGNSVRSVRVDGYSGQTVEVEPDEDDENDDADDNDDDNDEDSDGQENNTVTVAQVPEPVADSRPSTSYSSPGVAHDTSCGGDFVLGTVYNRAGQLVQAVAVV